MFVFFEKSMYIDDGKKEQQYWYTDPIKYKSCYRYNLTGWLPPPANQPTSYLIIVLHVKTDCKYKLCSKKKKKNFHSTKNHKNTLAQFFFIVIPNYC